MKDLKLTRKKDATHKTQFQVGSAVIGDTFTVIAGPCSVENERQTIEAAIAVREAGATLLRGGAFKPRTSPYAFQGLGMEGLKILNKARRESGLPVVTEVIDTRDIGWVAEYADVVQIGARNMQNFSLLREAGRCGKPILLKRGMHSTLHELLNCAEYILAEGNMQVILCERGIRTFETYTRNTLDLSMVPAVKELSHLPVMVDPSHGTGKLSLVEPMGLAALASGADGIAVEVHGKPEEALSDSAQQMNFDQFRTFMKRISILREAMAAAEREEQAAADTNLIR